MTDEEWAAFSKTVKQGDKIRVVFESTVDQHGNWVYAWSQRHTMVSAEIVASAEAKP
jgi:hypothetical protein